MQAPLTQTPALNASSCLSEDVGYVTNISDLGILSPAGSLPLAVQRVLQDHPCVEISSHS